MESNEKKGTGNPAFVVVTPEEAVLVQEANEIEKQLYAADKAQREQCAKEGKPNLQDPMLFFNTPRDAQIVRLRNEIARNYQQERGFKTLPTLFSPFPDRMFPNQIGVQHSESFHQYRRSDRMTDSPSDLEEVLLRKVPIKRRGETLFAWGRTCYERISDNEMKGLIGEVLREELRHGNAPALMNSILTLLQTDRRITMTGEEDFDWIATDNGQLNWKTFQFTPQPNPEFFLTHYRKVTWRGPQDCPTFMNFLNFISHGEKELFTRLMEVTGFLLSPDYYAKKFVLFQGVGDSGKSVLGSLIQSFYAPEDVSSLSVHQFSERFALSAIAGRSLNVSMDLPNGILDSRAVAVIKQITGRDTLSIEAKNRQPYSDRIYCNLLFGTNHPVEMKTRDEAMAKRLLLVPFHVPVPSNLMDPNLLKKLLQEKSGIFYHCLRAYHEVLRRNYQFIGEERFGFKLQEVVLLVQPAESVKAFLSQCCQIEPDSFLSTEQLHQAFEAFCSSTGLPGIADCSAFSRAFRTCLGNQVKATKRRVGGVPLNGYIGIKFQDKTN